MQPFSPYNLSPCSYTTTVNDHQGKLRTTLTKSYGSAAASTDLVGISGTAASGDLVGDLGGAETIGSGGTVGVGGSPIGGGILELQKPRLHYTSLTAYSPYGLPLADWQGDDERYLYSGKELDRDGGLWLYDFHARQYDPQLGRFTTPDPLQEKYLPLSPYLYCAANPISLIDPSGMTIKINSDNGSFTYHNGKVYSDDDCTEEYDYSNDKYVSKAVEAIGEICKSDFGNSMITELSESDNEFNIMHPKHRKKGNRAGFETRSFARSIAMNEEVMKLQKSSGKSGGSGGSIYWDPADTQGGLRTDGRDFCEPFLVLAHEFGHATDSNRGMYFPRYSITTPLGTYDAKFKDLYKTEWRAVYMENTIRLQLGIPLRCYYEIEKTGRHISGVGPYILSPDNEPINYP